MASYSIQQVEKLLGLPSSTLRHWERQVSLLAPRRDLFGRRRYSTTDVRLLLRLKHLAQKRGLGLSAGRLALEAEIAGPEAEARSRLAEIRGELVALFAATLKAGDALGKPEEARDRSGPEPEGGG